MPPRDRAVTFLYKQTPCPDLQHLFDAGPLKIERTTREVRLSDDLEGTDYWIFHGQTLRDREDGTQNGEKLLRDRWEDRQEETATELELPLQG